MSRQFFGGMGSLTDLFLCHENGHQQTAGRGFDEANRRVEALRHEIYEVVSDLLAGIEDPEGG